MKQNRIPNLPKLRNDNYENIFNVYEDSKNNNKYFYNLLQTAVLPSNLPDGYYVEYTVTYGDTWPFISYKAYRTPNLWWTITSVNDIIDPTKPLEPGTILKLLKSKYVSLILSELMTKQDN